ncbi:hypothetical protein HDU92_001988 [Lobulomyces angularis]|nr:hypothetical protein HDU92_001988 [Lobulomyces angularis]
MMVGDLESISKRKFFSKSDFTPCKNSSKVYELKDFKLIKTIGTGTFGRVYLTKFHHNSEYFAMKILKKGDVVRLKQVEHVNNERNILISIKFPFIIKLFQTFQDKVSLYMLQEYGIGGEVFSYLRKNERFDDYTTKFYIAEVILAIEYLHSQDIIYRDLKPENLLLDSIGHIKIVDFGFARKIENNICYTFCGTNEYLAPEIVRGKGYGKSVDWWALGILTYEFLVGFTPFYDASPLEIYKKIFVGEIKFYLNFNQISKDFVRRLLQQDLTRRLGNLKNGVIDIKSHRWFQGIDFNELLCKNSNLRVPFKPTFKSFSDTGNFDAYEEINLKKSCKDKKLEFQNFDELFKGKPFHN